MQGHLLSNYCSSTMYILNNGKEAPTKTSGQNFTENFTLFFSLLLVHEKKPLWVWTKKYGVCRNLENLLWCADMFGTISHEYWIVKYASIYLWILYLSHSSEITSFIYLFWIKFLSWYLIYINVTLLKKIMLLISKFIFCDLDRNCTSLATPL